MKSGIIAEQEVLRGTMNGRDGFAGGFIIGAILGGVIGGLLGAVLSRRIGNSELEEASLLKQSQRDSLTAEESMEIARRGLEDKIAQLNLAIDDVRQRMETPDDSEATA